MITAVNNFGFPKKTEYQQAILHFFEQEASSVSLTQLHAASDIRSRQTILSYVQELATLIDTHSSKNSLHLTVEMNRGITLHRNNHNLAVIKEKLYTDTLAYRILHQLFFTRRFPSEPFCKKHQISFSKLRRQIKKINQYLAFCNVQIKVGNQVQMIGDERHIQSLFFLFFYQIYRGLSQFPQVTAQPYLEEAQALVQTLRIDGEAPLLDIIALALFVNKQSSKMFPLLPAKFRSYIGEAEDRLDDNALEMFLMLEAFDFLVVPRRPYHLEKIQQWIRCFKEVGGQLTAQEVQHFEQFAWQEEMKQALFFEPTEWLTPIVGSTVTLTEQQQKRAKAIFEETWQLFQHKYPEDYPFKQEKLWQAYLQIVPKKQWLATIAVYIQTSLPCRIKYQVQQHISQYFEQDYHIRFVNTVQEAQLVLSTERHALDTTCPVLLIEPQLFHRDWQQLTQSLQKLSAS